MTLPACARGLAALVIAGSVLASGALAQGKGKDSGAALPGGDDKEPIQIDAAKLDYYDKEQKLVYTGDVVARQGGSTLKSTVLVLYLTPKPEGAESTPSSTSDVKRMEATGPVTLITKDQVSTGDRGVYEKGEDTLYLYGNVTVTQGTNVTKGDKLAYDLTTKKAVIVGRVKSMFQPKDDDKKQKPKN